MPTPLRDLHTFRIHYTFNPRPGSSYALYYNGCVDADDAARRFKMQYNTACNIIAIDFVR